jgi:lysozyme
VQISENGLALIRRFEGCSLVAYLCPAGKWTVGYGWTQPVGGRPVQRGMKISQAQAERLLRCGVVQYEQAVSRVVRVPLTQNQFDALVSLAYNIGPLAFSTSTLVRMLNAGNYTGAADQFLRWNKSGKKILPGLVARRGAERELFLS